MNPKFNNWWNDDNLTTDNPFKKDTPIFWAWEGWVAGVTAEREVPAVNPKKLDIYSYTIKLHPWGDAPEMGVVEIDPVELYGYYEARNGAEGGGLWFERSKDGALELVDYDGQVVLPKEVIAALRQSGVIVDESFE